MPAFLRRFTLAVLYATLLTFGLNLQPAGTTAGSLAPGAGPQTNKAYLDDAVPGVWTQVPGHTTSTLHGVAMLSSTNGWAVGGIPQITGHPSQDSIIRHWNGAAWESKNSPIPNPLYAVSMHSATLGFAVGVYGRVLLWNGTSWANVTVPIVNCLQGVTMVSATEVWAVGCNGKTLHGTTNASSTTWTIVSAADSNEFLYAVYALSPTDVWTVGSHGVIRRWNGSAWTTVASPVTSTLTSIHMLSATDGWITGYDGVILHWDGAAWTQVASPVTVSLYALSMVSATDGWAVGGAGTYYLGGDGGTILHWDGTSWTEVTSPVTNMLFSVHMLSASEGWAVGSGGAILHYEIPHVLHSTYLPLIVRQAPSAPSSTATPTATNQVSATSTPTATPTATPTPTATATPTPTDTAGSIPHDGIWAGVTDLGGTFSFRVSGGGTQISQLILCISTGGACGASTVCHSYPAFAIADGSFATTSWDSEFAGSFTSTTASAGTYKSTVSNSTGCQATRSGTWSASLAPTRQ